MNTNMKTKPLTFLVSLPSFRDPTETKKY